MTPAGQSLHSAAPRLSATVMLLREGDGRLEVLMQRRADALTFGGTWVFPGGAVESADGDPAQDLPGALRRAAIRELAEEAGVRLRAQAAPASPPASQDPRSTPALIQWSRWITPAVRPRRFDTWFFAAALPEGEAVVGDAVEAVESAWLEPAEAIAGRESGRLAMMPPTLLSLIDLQRAFVRHGSLARLLAGEAARATPPILPRVLEKDGSPVAVYPWDPAYPLLAGEGIDIGGAPEHLLALPSRMRFVPA